MARTELATWTRRISTTLACAAFLAGCAYVPLASAPRSAPTDTPASVVPAPNDDGNLAAGGAADISASGAEQACVAAGRERGLDVAGVVGSTAVTGTNGEASRDVMLRVRRSGAEIEVRCNYVASTRMARIMLI